MIIRDGKDEDGAGIARTVERAFGRADEAWLVERLRRDGDAAISLVAVGDDAVVGHVMLSRMSTPFRALGLGPLAVLPEFRERGIAAALTQAAIDRARAEGWSAVFVLGDPRYYGRFGFRADLAAGFSSPYAGPHLMALALHAALPSRSGRIDYAPAFAALT